MIVIVLICSVPFLQLKKALLGTKRFAKWSCLPRVLRSRTNKYLYIDMVMNRYSITHDSTLHTRTHTRRHTQTNTHTQTNAHTHYRGIYIHTYMCSRTHMHTLYRYMHTTSKHNHTSPLLLCSWRKGAHLLHAEQCSPRQTSLGSLPDQCRWSCKGCRGESTRCWPLVQLLPWSSSRVPRTFRQSPKMHYTLRNIPTASPRDSELRSGKQWNIYTACCP